MVPGTCAGAGKKGASKVGLIRANSNDNTLTAVMNNSPGADSLLLALWPEECLPSPLVLPTLAAMTNWIRSSSIWWATGFGCS